jgi:hypothetical protein
LSPRVQIYVSNSPAGLRGNLGPRHRNSAWWMNWSRGVGSVAVSGGPGFGEIPGSCAAKEAGSPSPPLTIVYEGGGLAARAPGVLTLHATSWPNGGRRDRQ